MNKDRLLQDICIGVLEKGVSFRFKAKGSSMSPFIKDGAIITITPLKRKLPRIGDIVTFLHPRNRTIVVHRIIARNKGKFLIKADNAYTEDGLFCLDELIGIVTEIEQSGKSSHLGLGPERLFIAIASRLGILQTLVKLVVIVKKFFDGQKTFYKEIPPG